jgi:hypothetical protein
MKSELVTPAHLERRAVVYIRQSTPAQMVSNQESLRLQYALTERARDLGWHTADVDVIDADLGQSGASLAGRDGFKDLAARVGLGEIGIVLSVVAPAGAPGGASLVSRATARTGTRCSTSARCAAA